MSSTRSCWPTRAWPGSASSTWSPRSSSRTRCSPRPGRARWRWNAATTDQELAGLLAGVDDPDSHAAATAERGVLAGLQAGCSAPVGAYAIATDMLRLRAAVIGDDGAPPLAASAAAPAGEAEALGLQVARELLGRGAGRYLTAAAAHTSNGDDAQ